MKTIFDTLNKEVKNLQKYLQAQDMVTPEVSEASVYWHIQHSLLTIEKIFEALQKSTPNNYKYSFTIRKFFVLSVGIIPRGRAQSPAQVIPSEQYTSDQIYKETQKIQALLPLFTELPERAYFEHPFLGNLKKQQALRFLAIHTNHHIKIIKDITQAHKN